MKLFGLFMNIVVGILASIAVVHAAPYTGYNGHYTYPAATSLVRTPEHDSAVVRSDRFGGNFAYSIAQRHAYQVLVPQTVDLYNHDPFGYSYHNQIPFGARPGHHFYIQHPFTTAIVPTFVPVVHPVYPDQQPTEEYPDEQTEPEDSVQTENPDAESVNVGENADADSNGNREETTEEFNGSDDTTDDSITVDAYRFGGVD